MGVNPSGVVRQLSPWLGRGFRRIGLRGFGLLRVGFDVGIAQILSLCRASREDITSQQTPYLSPEF